jgi:hypothetical protein
MKKNMFKILIFSFLLIASQQLIAQGPPPPPGDPSLQGPPVGGSAPIGGGIEILMLMAVGYGTRKSYMLRMKKRGLDEE